MQFNDVLDDIDKLIGVELKSINPKTSSIYVTSINHELKKYYVSNSPDMKGMARSFRELEDIWKELKNKGFSNVDQALYGGGSSRNQPETIFAHLPYIQYFKYKNKKHLLLRDQSIHKLGVLSELKAIDLRDIRKKIDNYTTLSNKSIANHQSKIIKRLENSFDAILKKYPGDIQMKEAEKNIGELIKLNQKISDSIVSLDDFLDFDIEDDESLVDKRLDMSIDKLIDDESLTGIENTNKDDIEEKGDNKTNPSRKTKIRQLTPVVSLIYDRLSFNEIELQPDFQRKDRVWPLNRKAKLIESILMGLPLPVFYFAEKPNGDWIIVDGLQRITTIYDFMRGEFQLSGLESLKGLNGKTFSTLDRTEQRKIREYSLTAHLIDINSENDSVIVELFHRINTYGVKLSSQEIRSALNQGSSVKFLRYLAATSEFRSATHGRIKSDRQKDMELCLSALSFMLQGYKNFNNKYNEYLSKAMKIMNGYELRLTNQERLDQGESKFSDTEHPFFRLITEKFRKGLIIAEKVFENYAFKKTPDPAKNIPISKPLFELIVTYFSELSDDQAAKVIEHRHKLIDMLYKAIDEDSSEYAVWESTNYKEENRGFLYSISQSTGKKVTVRFRFESFHEIVRKSTGIEISLQPVINI